MKELNLILETKDINAFRAWCSQKTVVELAESLQSLKTSTKQLVFFRMLKTESAAEVFTLLNTKQRSNLINNFTSNELKAVIDDLYTDEVVDLIEEMPSNIATRIYQNVASLEDRILINKLLKYTDEQVGSIMSVDLVFLKQHMSCKEALLHIKQRREVSEIVSYFFVVDQQKRVIGAISFEELFFEEEQDKKVTELLWQIETLYTMQPKEEAALIFSKHDLAVLPVVNHDGILVGMVTADDIIDVLQEESTEDYFKSVGISGEHFTNISYSSNSIFSIVKARIFWLVILMLGATLSQWIINSFQNYINNSHGDAIPPYLLTAIDSLIPVIAGTAGNAGSQSAATITRALALGEAKEKRKVIRKEILVGLTIGSLLFVINLLRLLIYYLVGGQLFLAERSQYLLLSLVSSLSIFLVIVLSKLVGTIIPLIAANFKKDPAVLSSPTLTTLTDAFATMIFFGLSLLVLAKLFPLIT